MASNPPPTVNVNAVLNGITSAVTSLIKPLEELAAYFGVVGIGVANVPSLPTPVRAVLAAMGGAHVVAPKIASQLSKPTTTTSSSVVPPA